MKFDRQTINKISNFQCYFNMLAGWVLCWFFKEYLDICFSFVAKLLSKCSVDAAIIIIIGLSVYLSYRCICDVVRARKYTAHKQIAFYSFFVVLYLYYRFIDKTFNFWTVKIIGLDFSILSFLLVPYAFLIIKKIFSPRLKKKDTYNSHLLLDTPIENVAGDKLGYMALVNALISDLSTVDVSKSSYSVGICGEWGLGKSSFLNLLKEQVEASGDICIKFCPRSSKNVSCIQEDFFKLYAQCLKRYHSGMSSLIENYVQSLSLVENSWYGKIALLWTQVCSRNQISHVNSAIKKIKRKIYVIVEDLDRLTGEEIVEVFKLVDKNGGFNDTIFLTAYDKKYINSVLRTFLNHDATTDFSDKYFNYEYPLPAQSSNVLISFVDSYLRENLSADDLSDAHNVYIENLIESWHSCSRLVVKHLKTLRHVKRFLNIFMSRYRNVKEDVFAHDFFLLTLIRYKNIELYHAIVNGVIVYAGGSLFETRKGVYLVDDYRERLKSLDVDVSLCDILEVLFPKRDESTNCINDYGKIRWFNSFDLYFYDYKPGRLYYRDLSMLYGNDISDSYQKISEYVQTVGAKDIEEFFISRTPEWVSSHGGIIRHVCLMIYLDHICRSLNLEAPIGWFLNKDTGEDYIKAGAYDIIASYKVDVDNAFREALEIAPMEVGFICISKLQAIYQDRNVLNILLFSIDEIQNYAEWAQKKYYSFFGESGFLFEAFLNLAYIPTIENGIAVISHSARSEFKSFICNHSEYFAAEIVLFIVNDVKGEKKLYVRFRDNFRIKSLFPVDGYRFVDWMKYELNAYSTVQVLYKLYDLHEKGDSAIEVPALKTEYNKGDFDSVWQAIESDENKKLDDTIFDMISNDEVYDIAGLINKTGFNVNQVRSSIDRLIANNRINRIYAALKEETVQLDKGDIVRLTEKKLKEIQKNYLYNENLFVISEINNGEVKFQDLNVGVSTLDIRPVLMDGNLDSKIYYDPIIAASTVGPNEPIPVHKKNYSYFIKRFDKCKYEGKTFNELMKGHNFIYVHEVQHWLRDNFNSDDLKINKSINQEYISKRN